MIEDARTPRPPRPPRRRRYLRAALCCLVVGLLIAGASELVTETALAEGLGRVSVLCTLSGITLTLAATRRAPSEPPSDRSAP